EEFIKDPSRASGYFMERYAVCHTSGSQGQPALVLQEKMAFENLFAMQVARGHTLPKTWTQFYKNFGNRRRWAIFLLRPGFFPSGSAFAHMPKPVRRFANVLHLKVTDPLEENVRKLNEFQPNFITGYTHVVENIAREQRAGRLHLREG